MLLVLDGFDKVGKTTLMKKIAQETKYAYPILDRGPLGFIAYNKLFDRHHELENHLHQQMLSMVNDEFIGYVYLTADPKVIAQRFIDTQEPFQEIPISQSIGTFNEIANRYRSRIAVIDTSRNTIDECVLNIKTLMDNLKSLKEKDYPLSVNAQSYMTLQKFLTHADSSTEYTRYLPETISLDKEMILNYALLFDEHLDKPYYDMIESKVFHLFHCLKLKLKSPRQMIYVSDDCISSIHFVLDIDNKVSQVYVYQRSLDVEKNRLNDLFFVCCLIQNLMKLQPFCDNISLSYTVGCPHEFNK